MKPEVHYATQRRRRRTEPRPLGDQHTKCRADRSSGSSDMLADRQRNTTDTQTDSQTNGLNTILRTPTGAE